MDKFHPALAITNVRQQIPVTLGTDDGDYETWAALFENHCKAFLVLDHLSSSAPTDDKDKDKDKDKDQWSRIDALVLQWIYSTISIDLLHTILEPKQTAKKAWDRLESIFQDNKSSRAVDLEQQFSNTRLDDYPSITAYCQKLKKLADKLGNVGSKVSNQRLVLQLIAGLNENYDGIATILQQSDPLPAFYEARSRLILEENRKAKQASSSASAAGTALYSAAPNVDSAGGSTRGPKRGNNRSNDKGKNKKDNRNRGQGGNQNTYSGNSFTPKVSHQNDAPATLAPQSWAAYHPWGSWSQWAAPPCPYPTTPWTRPQYPPRQSTGILGSLPP